MFYLFKRKKSQAALEFLTTYGWAFLVVLITIGGLSSLGVLDPSSFTSDSCFVSTPFICERVTLGQDGFLVSIYYSSNERLIVNEFSYEDSTGNLISCYMDEVQVNPNSRFIVECAGSNINSRNLKFYFSYRSITDSTSTFVRKASGDMKISRPNDFTVLSGSIPNNVEPDNLLQVLNNMQGTGTINDPYIITNDYELQAVSENLTANYILGNNINLAGTNNWNSGLGFDPIFNFQGTFNGNGYTISNLYINRPSQDYVGLFGFSVGVINNLSVTNVQVIGNVSVGGVVGYQWMGSMNNILVSGSVSSQADPASQSFVGGLAGFLYESFVTNSSSSVNVQSNGRDVGSAFGFIWDSQIEDSFSTGSVNAHSYSGGFIGYLYGSNSVTRSYSTGNVNLESGPGGGFAGMMFQGEITQSYASGNLAGNPNLGGFIGEISGGAIISDSFSLGDVTRLSTSIELVGGFVGNNVQSSITNSFSTGRVIYTTTSNPINKGFVGDELTGASYQDSGNYFDSQSSLQTTTSGQATPLTTSQMTGSNAQTNMPSLDFTSTWSITTSYPVLSWMN